MIGVGYVVLGSVCVVRVVTYVCEVYCAVYNMCYVVCFVDGVGVIGVGFINVTSDVDVDIVCVVHVAVIRDDVSMVCVFFFSCCC